MYKAKGCIQRAMLKRVYYAIHVHEGELQPSIPTEGMFPGLASPLGVAAHWHAHCSARVTQEIQGISDLPSPALSSGSSPAISLLCAAFQRDLIANRDAGCARCLT